MSRSVTWLFVPGSDRKKLAKVSQIKADAFIYDLEDAVANQEKMYVRAQVKRCIKNHRQLVNYVRINGFASDFFYDDLTEVVEEGLRGIVLPKAETKAQIIFLDQVIGALERKKQLRKGEIKIVPLIESATGLYHAYEIASGSPRVEHLAFGAVDFSLNIDATLTQKGDELLYARSHLVVTSKAAGIRAPVDTVFLNIKDTEGFIEEASHIKKLGFHGKLLIHPNQIDLLNDVFMPTKDEIEEAKQIISAYKDSVQKGSGALQIDGKMIDLPIVEKAKRVLDRAGLPNFS